MKLIEILLSKIIDYVPSNDKKRIDELLLSNADSNQWLNFCQLCVGKGVSSTALHDEIYFKAKKCCADEDYIANTIIDVMDFLVGNRFTVYHG